MGEAYRLIGYDIAEQLAVIPRRYYLLVTKRAKYAPLDDSALIKGASLITAPRAPQLVPKSILYGSRLAQIITHKFVDTLPPYR